MHNYNIFELWYYIVIWVTLVGSFLDVLFLLLAVIFSELCEKPSFLCNFLLLRLSTSFPSPSDPLPPPFLYGPVSRLWNMGYLWEVCFIRVNWGVECKKSFKFIRNVYKIKHESSFCILKMSLIFNNSNSNKKTIVQKQPPEVFY